MTWQSEDGRSWPSANDRLRWAQKNYVRYDRPEKERRRLALLLNLITMDAMIQSEGGEPILSQGVVTDWLEMYEAYRPTLSVGRPPKNST